VNKPRLPNKEEIEELVHYVAESMGGFEANNNLEQAQGFVEQAYIAVFDNYVTDCVGYAGKVMGVIWASAPNMYEVFTFSKEGNLEKVNQDLSFVDKKEECKPF